MAVCYFISRSKRWGNPGFTLGSLRALTITTTGSCDPNSARLQCLAIFHLPCKRFGLAFSLSIRFPCRVCSLTNKPVGSPQATFIAKSEVSTRVLDTVKRFPKVDASKVREL
jgi:hypothetical protein